jgi:TPR repeat protein
MIRWLPWGAFLLALWAWTSWHLAPAAADMKVGVAHYERGDFEAALLAWLPLAEAGEAGAQFNIGVMYTRGQGVVVDHGEAIRWYRRAAEGGFVPALFTLGLVYQSGRGVPQDKAEAARWFRRAADAGSPDAQFSLAALYHQGDGVTQDMAEAVRWYRRAAQQGHSSAQNNLSVRYARGEGIGRDLVQAYLWTSLAAASASDRSVRDAASRNLDFYSAEMSPAELASAEKLVRAWRPKPETQAAAQPARARAAGAASEREQVKATQILLRRLGYDPGAADGKAGAKTVQAVKRFQGRVGLAVDGDITPALIERLKSEAAKAKR